VTIAKQLAENDAVVRKLDENPDPDQVLAVLLAHQAA
jgi:hypothetical protein